MKPSRLIFFIAILIVLIVPVLALAQTDPPIAPTNIVVNPNQGRPTISWVGDANAEWYEIYISTPDFSKIIHDTWYSVDSNSFGFPQASCAGLTCTAKPNIDPNPGTYLVWMLAWGPGGYSAGGVENSGWNKSSTFTIPNTRPSNTAVTISNLESGDITVNWQGASFTTWYQFWIGTSAHSVPQYVPKYVGWHLAEEVGCENAGTCAFDPNLNLPDGDYEVWMQVYGPAGFSTNQDDNWFLASTFTVGAIDNNPGTGTGSGILSSVEQQVLDLLNADRKAAGMGCLVAQSQLQAAALRHSTDLSENFGPNTNPQISHTGTDGSTAGGRITDAGYKWSTYGENVAVGQSTAQQVYDAWYNSAGHYANMFNENFDEIGISLVQGGDWGFNWTMDLAARSGSQPGACP